MNDRFGRFPRLLRLTEDRQRLLQVELQRAVLARREVELALEILDASPVGAPTTAAGLAHAERLKIIRQRQRAALQERLQETRAAVAAGQERLRQTSETRRTIERLLARLEDRRRRSLRRQAEGLLDDRALRQAPEWHPW